MDLRPYTPADRAACLALFDINALPPATRAGFERHLDGVPAGFLVAEHDGRLVGCGGYGCEGGSPRLEWCLVDPALHRNGIGRLLAMTALRAISSKSQASAVSASSTGNARGFFEHLGFRAVSNGPEGIVEMVKKLDVCG
jgi:N-acetylglutamate synthase-like GNAT family acetyltransferase